MFRMLGSLVDPFLPPAPQTKPDASAWRFLWHQLRPLRPVMAASLLLTAVGVAIEVWLIGYAGALVDLLALTPPAELWTRHGGGLLLAAAMVVIARPLAGLVREGLDDIAFRPNAETLLRWRAHRHVLGQSVGWFRSDLAGRIAGHVRDIGSTGTGVAYSIVHTLSFVTLYIIGSLWLFAAIDARLMLPLGAWVGCYIGLMVYLVPRLRAASGRYQEEFSGLTGLLVDSYANIDTIKLFASPEQDDREARQRFAATRAAFLEVQKLEVTMNMSMLLLGSLLVAGLVGYGIVLWQGGSAPLGLVAAALALSFRITAMGEWMLDAVSSLFGNLGALRESLKTVGQPIEIIDAPGAPDLQVRGGSIRFAGVSHHYGRGDGGLEGVTLEVAAGEKVGLVGRSGAGKSTLVNLLLRFYEPEAGRIEIDGQDIGTVTQESLRRQIGMVVQDAALLHRSVRDNIAYGRSEAEEQAIAEAAEQARAAQFIARLADQQGRRGYAAHVGERGVTLSGGQRQRLALARAILKNAPILILDEATSALDSEVEAEIQETLYSVMEGKTVIAIAHRLSTIARLDRIVVLDGGQVVEQGTHAELLDNAGLYARLWARQAGGFIGVDGD